MSDSSVYEKDYDYNDESDRNLTLVADIENFAKDFKVFGGWSVSKYSTWKTAKVTFEDGDNISTYISSGNLDLYPIWIPFTVNIHSNTTDDNVLTYEVNADGTVMISKETLSSTFTYLGFEIDHLSNTANIADSTETFEFTGDETQITFSSSSDSVLDLFIAYKAKTFTLQFVATGNTLADLTVVSTPQGGNAFAEVNSTQSVTLYGASDLIDTYAGWSFDSNLTTFDGALSQNFILTNEILTKTSRYQTLEDDVIVFYALTSSTYTITYDLNANGHNVINGSTTSILPNGTNSISATSINNITNLVFADATGKVWEIADTQTGSFSSVYAYFLGWSQDSSATEPTYFNGGENTARFATNVTLYAVWKQYTNPFYFTYSSSAITGLSNLGKDYLTSNSTIIVPKHSLNLTGGVITIGDTITSVSFAENSGLIKIKSLDFSSSQMVTSFPDLAFANLSNLESILNIPSSVTIGYGAFACEKLNEITFASIQSNYFFDEDNNIYVLSGNTAKLHTVLPINSISDEIFNLSSTISVNDTNYSVTELLPYSMFKTQYIFIIIPNSVIEIGQNALKQTDYLINLNVPFVGENDTENTNLYYLFGNAESVPASLKVVTVTNQTEVKSGAFKDCSNISTVIYTAGDITIVNDDAFNGCSSYFVTNQAGEIDFEKLQTIGINAFRGCTNIAQQVILSSVIEIGDNAFTGTSLEYVEINRLSQSLSNKAFENVTTLTQAKVYKLNAFVSVVSITGIYKKTDINFNSDQIIFVDSILFSILNRAENAEYLEYNIVVEDMVELYNSSKEYKSSYGSLQEALLNANRNDIIIIKYDITLDSMIIINKNITILAAFETLSSSEEGASEYNDREVTLTRSATLTTNAFSIRSDNVTFGYSGEFKAGYKVASLNIVGNNNVNASSLFSINLGTLTLSSNLTISNNTSKVGAVAYISDGEVIVDGAEIFNNKAVEQTGSIITGNGGVFYLDTKSYLNIISGEIYSNSATRGGVAYSTYHSVITIREQSGMGSINIYNNSATEGGVLYIASSILDESASNIIGKSSIYSNNPVSYTDSYGGAVCIASGMLKIEDDAHIYNCSSGNGGAIAVKKGILIVGKSLIGGESANGYANQAYSYGTSSGGKGGAVYVGDQGILRVISGAVLSHNQAQYGGNIYFASTLTDSSNASKISGGTISYGNSLVSLVNSTNYLGGAIYCASGTLSIANATLKNNLAGYGGAIYTINTTLTLSNNALIDSNDAGKDGGGLFIAKSSSIKLITLDGSIFKNNLSQGNGGAIAVTGDEVDILETSNATLIGLKDDALYKLERFKGGNKALLNGGGIYIAGSGKVNVLGESIIQNNFAVNGGGIYYYNGGLILKSAIIRYNEASSNGGGIFVSDGSGDTYKTTTTINETFEIYNATLITLNSAENGAGLYVGDREVSISNAQILSNTAKDSGSNGQKGKGGAIFISSGAILILDEVNISGNKTTNAANLVAYSGIYLNSTAQNALQITNSTSLDISTNATSGDTSNPVYLIEGAVISILDEYTEDYIVKLFMQHILQSNEQILVARFADEKYASSAKFIANEIVFMQQGAEIYAAEATVQDFSSGVWYATINDAINQTKETKLILMLIDDQYINSSSVIQIPAGREVVIVSRKNASDSTQGYKIIREFEQDKYYTGYMFNVFGTLSFYFDDEEISLYSNAEFLNVPVVVDGNSNAQSAIICSSLIQIYKNGIVNVNSQAYLINNNALNGGAIYVGADETVKETDNVAVLNFNGGHIYNNSATQITQSVSGNGGAIYVYNGTVNLLKGTLGKYETGVYSGNNAVNGGAIYLLKGNLYSKQIVIEGNTASNGGAIYVHTDGFVEMERTTLSNNKATSYGGAISLYSTKETSGGDYVLSGVTFSNNVVTNGNGGAIYVYYGLLVLNGFTDENSVTYNSTLSNNTALNGNGGAIAVEGYGIIQVIEVTFTSNSAKNGGALSFSASETDRIIPAESENKLVEVILGENGKGNTATNGGAVYVSKGLFNISSSTSISYNTATNGGGIYACEEGSLVVTNSTVSENTAVKGAGIYFASVSVSGNVSLYGVLITNNSTVENSFGMGGGIYIAQNSLGALYSYSYNNAGTIIKTTITSNTSYAGGAGVYIAGGQVILQNTTISSNTTSTFTGAGLLVAGGAVSIENVTITSNVITAEVKDGQGIYFAEGTLRLFGNNVITNSSSGYSGIAINNVTSITSRFILSGAIDNINDSVYLMSNKSYIVVKEESLATSTVKLTRQSDTKTIEIKLLLDESKVNHHEFGDVVVDFDNAIIAEQKLSYFSVSYESEFSLLQGSEVENSSSIILVPQYFEEINSSGEIVGVYYTLQDAVLNAQSGNLILINIGDKEESERVYYIDSTIVTPNTNKSLTITTRLNNTKISRGLNVDNIDFTGNMFNISSTDNIYFGINPQWASVYEQYCGVNYATFGLIFFGGTYSSLETDEVNSTARIFQNSGTLTLSQGIIITNEHSSSNGPAVMTTNGTLNIFGAEIYDNSSTLEDENGGNGGAIYLSNSTLVITDIQMYGNTAVNGGAIYLQNSTATISNGIIGGGQETLGSSTNEFSNKATNGGGIYLLGSTLTLSDTAIISQNYAEECGGGLYLTTNSSVSTTGEISFTSSKLTINGATISYNLAGTNGGGIYVEDNFINVANDNATESEKETFFNSRLNILLSSGLISYNSANVGGGIYATSYSSSNDIKTLGGVTYVTGTNGTQKAVYRVAVRLNGGEIISNNATNESFGLGGGIYADGCELHLGGGISISENIATVSGGGMYYKNSLVRIDDNTTISFNTAYKYGGGIFSGDKSITNIGDVLSTEIFITGNSALGVNDEFGFGGGIYMKATSKITLQAVTIKGNSVNSTSGLGSAIYVDAENDGDFTIGSGLDSNGQITTLSSNLIITSTGDDANSLFLANASQIHINAEYMDSITPNEQIQITSTYLYTNYNRVIAFFNQDTSKENIDESLFVGVDSNDNTYCFILNDYREIVIGQRNVARVNNGFIRYYTTLESAFSNIDAQSEYETTLVILNDLTITNAITLSGANKVTIMSGSVSASGEISTIAQNYTLSRDGYNFNTTMFTLSSMSGTTSSIDILNINVDGSGANSNVSTINVTGGTVNLSNIAFTKLSGGGSAINVSGGYALIDEVSVTQSNATNGLISITGSGSVTITNSSITGDTAHSTVNGALYVDTTGTVNLSETNITNNVSTGNGGAVNLQNGTLHISMSSKDVASIQNNFANRGGGIYVNGGSLELTNIKLTGNKAVDGAGIYLNSGTINLSSSNEITNNTALQNGGGIFVSSSAIITVNCSVTLNEAVQGGGIYYSGVLNLVGNEISNNTATLGGGLYSLEGMLNTSLLNTTKVTLSSNSALSYGGGMYLNTSTLTLDGTILITLNDALCGGGIATNNSILTMNGIAITSNTATSTLADSGNGGGVYVISGTVTFAEGEISLNTASVKGGGIFEADGELTLDGNYILASNSANEGGGLYQDSGTLDFTSGIIGEPTSVLATSSSNSNSASLGGGMFLYGGTSNIVNGLVSNCFASVSGGGIYIYEPTLMVTSLSVSFCNAVLSGGGIYYAKDDVNASLSQLNIFSNSSANGGGMLVNSLSAVLTLENVSIYKNTATNGGGINISKGILELSSENSIIGSTTLENGNVAENGGGIFINKDGKLLMNEGKISFNTATKGGAIFNNSETNEDITFSGIFEMTGGSLNANSANSGAGLYNLGMINITSGTFSLNDATNGGALYYAGGVVSNFTDVNIFSNTAMNGGALFIATTQSNYFILSGGTISSNSAVYGGGVFVQSGIFKMSGGVIGDDSATLTATASSYSNTSTKGSGIYATGGELQLVGGKINYNFAQNGGGIAILSGAITTISGTTISFNNAGLTGGGVYIENTVNPSKIQSGTISHNSASNGGGIYVSGSVSVLNIVGGVVEDNTAVNGGGIYLVSSKVAMTGGTVSSNIATNGGGVYVATSANFEMSNTATIGITSKIVDGQSVPLSTCATLSDFSNFATYGGGVFVQGTLNFSNGYISYNCATYGGGIYTQSGAINITNTSAIIQYNYSSTDGGGIYLANYSGVSVNVSGTVGNNKSLTNGGGIYVINPTVNVSIAGTIKGNQSLNGGGVAFYTTNSNVLNIASTIFENTAQNGGGIYLGKGTIYLTKDVRDNEATNNGGGVYVLYGYFYVENNAYIGELSDSKTATMAEHSNSAGLLGGGVYVSQNGNLTVKNGGSISYNYSLSDGGGVYIYQSSTTINGTVSFNFASGNGGGIYVKNATLLVNEEGRVSTNGATGFISVTNQYITDGGHDAQTRGVYCDGGKFTLSGTLIEEKTHLAFYSSGTNFILNATGTITGDLYFATAYTLEAKLIGTQIFCSYVNIYPYQYLRHWADRHGTHSWSKVYWKTWFGKIWVGWSNTHIHISTILCNGLIEEKYGVFIGSVHFSLLQSYWDNCDVNVGLQNTTANPEA